MNDRLIKYSSMMPEELKILVNDAPHNDLEWALAMYLFENTRKGNNITLTKISDFFDTHKDVIYLKLNIMSPLWIKHYMNKSDFGQIYYTYEITDIAADFMINLIKLLQSNVKL